MITTIQNDACFLGSIVSLLIDCNCTQEQKDEIIIKTRNLMVGNNPNTTYIEPNSVPDFLKEIFGNSSVYHYEDINEISSLVVSINNQSTFALLFWNGNNNGENRHVTRYVKHFESYIELMEPSCGKLQYYDYSYLQNLSPNGFDLVYLEKKIFEN